MEKYYLQSRIILGIATVLICLIMFVHEDIGTKIYGTIFITMPVVLISFIFTPMSKKLIEVSDHFSSKILSILFYIGILVGIFIAFYLFYAFIIVLDDNYSSTSLSDALGHAILLLYLVILFLVACIVPYFQSIIVLMIRFLHLKKENKK